MKKNFLFILSSVVLYHAHVFAAPNSPSVQTPVIPAIQTEEKFQVPLLINNTTQENIQKIENSVSQEVREQALTSKSLATGSPQTLSSSEMKQQDDKPFLDKKRFLKENKNEPSLWQGASLVVGFISLIGILAFILTRFHKKGGFKKVKNDKAMNIISTLSISPKRQVMLLQIRDKEIVISNTETGINFISDMGNTVVNRELAIEKKPFQISNFIKSIPASEQKNPNNETEDKNSFHEKKSDILMKALKRIENNQTVPEKNNNKEENVPETNEANGKFPKYFSSIFENESKKEIKKKEEPDSVENVTNLIREKLRSMKPLN